MNRNLSTSKQEKLKAVLGVALATHLPPLFRLYHELRKRAQAGAEQVTIVPDELASVLGYEIKNLHIILCDLKALGVIDYEPQPDTRASHIITILVG